VIVLLDIDDNSKYTSTNCARINILCEYQTPILQYCKHGNREQNGVAIIIELVLTLSTF